MLVFRCPPLKMGQLIPMNDPVLWSSPIPPRKQRDKYVDVDVNVNVKY